jgi:hypothetical protein
MKPETFLDKFKKIAETEGFTSLEEFVNEWVQSGETFASLREWLMLNKDMNISKTLIWKTLRKYLTIPYTHEDQFWYKWNAISKVKGFKNPKHMIEVLRKRKLCNAEMAEEIGVTSEALKPVIKHLLQERIEGKIIPKRKYERRYFKMSRDADGISFRDARDSWRKRLREYGYRSLKDAIWRLKRKGYNLEDMAKLFGTTPRNFRYRRRRAGL